MSDRIVVMGVAGSGKSTVGAALAAARGVRFIESDELHPRSNVDKMSAGIPLADADRWPWLAAVRREMRREEEVVVACSALRRSYRDALRAADGVRFVHLVLAPDESARRLRDRSRHYMVAGMSASQFATLEDPGEDEIDIADVSSAADPPTVLERVEAALADLRAGTAAVPIRVLGHAGAVLSSEAVASAVASVAAAEVLDRGARRVLVVPPDHTRLQSRAGEITACLYEALTATGCDVAVLPAVGTHAALTADHAALLFGDRVPHSAILRHRWREEVERVGEIDAAEVAALSGGAFGESIPIDVASALLGSWDLVVSIGQIVPHEVVGMANFTKNLVIGLGGADTIDRSHYLGALCGIESVMGRAHTPVRDVIDAAFDRFLAPRVQVLWILTVVADTPTGVVHRALLVGRGTSGESGGAAYRAAAELAARCNIATVPRPVDRMVCRLDADEFTTIWLANKAVYRTRMAIADGGELTVLAPAVSRFADDAAADALIRRHGYRGTAATLRAVAEDVELAANLGAAAHLIHGSSEGRFTIVYCTDPDRGGLSREAIEGVGYSWRDLSSEQQRLGVTTATPSGRLLDRDGASFDYVANPALGLWKTARPAPERDDGPGGDARAPD